MPSATWAPTRGAPLRLLAADDGVDLLESFSMVLRLLGHRVLTCSHGARAVELVQRWQPHIAFVDLEMGDVSGLDVARAVRASIDGRTLVLVAMTGRNGDGDRQEAARAGFDRYQTKPVGLPALTALLNESYDLLVERGGLA